MWIQLRVLLLAACATFLSGSVFQLTTVAPGMVATDASGTDSSEIQLAAPGLTSTQTPPVPFGIQIFGDVNDPVKRELMVAAGIRWVRQDVYWSSIEPVNDNGDPNVWNENAANWGRYDTTFANAASAGFKIIATIGRNPAWAASTACGRIDRVSLDEFKEFLTVLVNRYKGAPYNVKYWELYNEPDIKDPSTDRGELFGGCWGNDGAAYAQMLAVAEAAIHAADPEAKVLLGPLAYEWWSGDFFNSGIDPSITPGPTEWSTSGNEFPDFFEVVLNNGGGDHFDVMSFHDYIVFHPRWDLPDDGSLPGDEPYTGCTGRPQEGDILGKLIYLRKRLMKHSTAYGNKPFIVSELGRRSDAGQPMLQQGCLGGNVPGSDEQQSRYVVQGNVRAMAAGVEAAIWFKLVDEPDGREYGLLDVHMSPKPAYWAYKTTADELEGYHFVRQLSSSETGGFSDVEGYLFENGDGNRKWVLWTPTRVSGEAVRQVSFPVAKIRVVPKQKYDAAHPDTEIPGVVQIIQDGDVRDLDGVVNGQVAINITASPVFVQEWP